METHRTMMRESQRERNKINHTETQLIGQWNPNANKEHLKQQRDHNIEYTESTEHD